MRNALNAVCDAVDEVVAVVRPTPFGRLVATAIAALPAWGWIALGYGIAFSLMAMSFIRR